jgi:hypothetical protein
LPSPVLAGGAALWSALGAAPAGAGGGEGSAGGWDISSSMLSNDGASASPAAGAGGGLGGK